MDEHKLKYIVLRKVPLQMMMMSFLSRQEGELPFSIRVDRVVIPAGAEWERHYSESGNDRWEFKWTDCHGRQRVKLYLFTDQACEILSVDEDGFLPAE